MNISLNPNIISKQCSVKYDKMFSPSKLNSSDTFVFRGGNKQNCVETSEKTFSNLMKKNNLYAQEIRNTKLDYKLYEIKTLDSKKTVGRATIIYDESENESFITILNKKDFLTNGEILIYNKDGILLKKLDENQSDALIKYNGITSQITNKMLRENKLVEPVYINVVENIDSVFNDDKLYSIANENMTLYKGLSLNDEGINFIQKLVGKPSCYEENAFTSTSKDIDKAKEYGNLLFKITIPKGTKFLDMKKLISPASGFIDNNEILLNRNTIFLIKNFDIKNLTFELEVQS